MILICVGNGQQEADIQSQKIAKDRFLLYNGILDDSTVLSNGVWHTSIYDIKIPTPIIFLFFTPPPPKCKSFDALEDTDIDLIGVEGNKFK